VLRGGGWDDYARSCRSAYREEYKPGFRDYDVGFRLVVGQQPVAAREALLDPSKGSL